MNDEREEKGCEGSFDHNSPRPPVPGEEQAHQCLSDWGDASNKYNPKNECTTEASPLSGSTSPAYLSWARSLHRLLEDPDGADLFYKYLQSEGGQHVLYLDFWFACEGLKMRTEPDTIQQVAKVIYRKFFLKSALPIDEEVKKRVGESLKDAQCFQPPVTVFDEAQQHIGNLISNTTYPNFLKSDVYLQYIQSIQNPSSGSGELSNESSSSSSGSLSARLTNMATGIGPLPTLHEDMEFVPSSTVPLSHTPGTGCLSTGYHTPNLGVPIRLTKDTLLKTQNHRAMDVCPKPEAFAGLFMYRGLGAHAAYNSYNPVSRQDSEMHSVSSHSDARTESDTMSLTDSSVDGRSTGRSSRRKAAFEARQARACAALNKETHMHLTVIPRTQRLDTRQCRPLAPQEFAAILTERLENIKREQESQELLDKKLKEGDLMTLNDVQPRELANAIRERLQLDDDNDQDILDQHVSRVFSDLTPSKSPGIISPRPHSPIRNRWMQMRPRRKDKDGISTFSGDSGNVYDFPEGSEHKLSMVKSKSMMEYDERFMRSSVGRRSSSKKTLTDFTDSGVSVVSDTPPVVHDLPKDQARVLTWLRESDRSVRGAGYSHSEMSMKHRGHRTNLATSPNASRHRNRSSSLERNTATGSMQPFLADPSIPPPPIPNTSVQLEEARRRLEDDLRTRSRQRSSNKHFLDISQSSQSTLRKSGRSQRSSVNEEVTTVVFTFCDEQFPYRTKIPGTQVTLKQFKEYLPKKGNYRYFFKTVCEELDDQVIQEEVSSDSDVLPLCEGKIMAQVKSID